MSGSAALEYGFPSTHSANAVSVAVYSVLVLHEPSNPFSPTTRIALEALAWFYAFSIVFGRLYCGMHGFLDVIIGSLMGTIISLVEFYYGRPLDVFMRENSVALPLLLVVAIVVLVRIHPEPADDCPCFDDSVAFAGVMIGLEAGTWRFAQSPWNSIYNGPAAPFSMSALGWPMVAARLVFGVLIIFAWREVMKPTLLKFLPHLFRVIETHGLSLPRRFFMRASEYENVPLRLRDDNVLPNVSDFPKLVRSIRGPGRGRSVSIGPQSAADAYETLAYRERRRRESIGSDSGVRNKSSLSNLRERSEPDEVVPIENVDQSGKGSLASGVHSSRLADYEQMMGSGTVVVTPPAASPLPNKDEVDADFDGAREEPDIFIGQQDELGEKEMFSRLVKPRVRYDVEVVTKLVVYAGTFEKPPGCMLAEVH
jgi:dihydrosphingosine 1-phosphate phosphatase